ncbi:MAG: efflux RND transporter permease subunit, partial [Arcobacteraceae bacterium]|nr:efflux RND transporter permease subunit [Arcobacteraceae bacterium]
MKNIIINILNSKTKQFFILLSAVVLLLVSFSMIYPFGLLQFKILPPKDSNSFSVYIDLPKNTTIKNTKKATLCVENILETISQVQNIQTYYGVNAPVDFIGLIKGSILRTGESNAQIVVNLSKVKDRDITSFVLAQDIRDGIAKKCSSYKDIFIVEEAAGPAVYGAIVAEIYGGNKTTRDDISHQIADILKSFDTLTDIEIKNGTPFEKFIIHIDKEKAVRYGLSVEQINKILYIAFEGMQIAYKNDDRLNEQTPIYLTLSDNTKKIINISKEDIRNKLSSLKLMNSQGGMVNLSEVVSIKNSLTQPPMYSKNLQDYTFVSCETKLASPLYPWFKVISIMKDKMQKEYEISNGSWLKSKKGKYFDLYLKDKKTGDIYQIVWDGEIQITLDILKDSFVMLTISVALILTLLVFYYKNIALSLIVLVGSLLAFIGIIAGHILVDIFSLHRVYFTGTSIVGFVALLGINARNTVLIIDFTQLKIDQGMSKIDAIATSTQTRTKPILLTAIGTILGSMFLVPDSVFGGL